MEFAFDILLFLQTEQPTGELYIREYTEVDSQVVLCLLQDRLR